MIPAIPPYNPIFGYSHRLKTDFKKGKLPIKFDLAGFELTKKNVTLDHVHPKSLGGESKLCNYVLNTAWFNNLRGNKPMKDFITKEMFYKWAKQFENLTVCGVDGLEYVGMIFKKIWG
jgi:hypothetical protein